MTKGTYSFGRRHTKTHTLCPRCGRSAWHIQKKRCAACAAGASAKKRTYQWGEKAIRRKTTGTGRMRSLKVVRQEYAGIQKANLRYKVNVQRALKKNLKTK
eukprot:TRINITY_DN1528_c0_g1_i1.p1 TRINITY_DN1528_c0_g1~~TRINITY_DN1528_c0_g1_i1.p1  ORF type:complete len:101 (-),score=15.99 TRINITY_DN1528_c0_g1_i1:112-414(-)